MSSVRVWRALLGVEKAVIERVELAEDDRGELAIVVSVRGRDAVSGVGAGCVCAGARGHDQGGGRRRWRHLDAGLLVVRPEVDAPRVACPGHGPTVVAVPWARHKAGRTRAFDDTVVWPGVATAKSTLCHLLRIAWRTVGSIVSRVAADVNGRADSHFQPRTGRPPEQSGIDP